MKDEHQISFRFPGELVRRIDAHVARLRKSQPGMNISRADAVRALISASLQQEEKKKR